MTEISETFPKRRGRPPVCSDTFYQTMPGFIRDVRQRWAAA